MKTYNHSTWTHKLVFAGVTVVIAIGALELVTGAMKSPNPEAMAIRKQVIAAQSERAQQIRALQQGEIRIATTATRGGL